MSQKFRQRSKKIENRQKIRLIAKELITLSPKNRIELSNLKRKLAKKYKISCPSNMELLKIYHKLVQKQISPHLEIGQRKTKNAKSENLLLERLLRTRPVRSLSGIVNVSILTKPYPCPGQCIFCPAQKGIPRSYLSKEPAVQRAILNKFSPSRQIKTRLKSLAEIGHPIDKIELRIIGGTWSFYPKPYQNWFITECFNACNNFSLPNKKSPAKAKKLSNAPKRKNLLSAQKDNEKALCRIVGLTIETRPDYLTSQEIKRLRQLGITRVELGVQSVYDDILKINKRGHNITATIKATRLLKDAGFKVSYQVMPNLLGSNAKRDIEMFKIIFQNPKFKPDLLKIYPLALIKQTPLYQWYQRGEYIPYSKKELIELLVEVKKHIPYWCRIQRIIRDIPSQQIVTGGVKISNLREIVQKTMAERGLHCKCIRCREVKNDYQGKESIYLFRQDYTASRGKEIFLSFENKTRSKLYAILRLRIPSFFFENPLQKQSATTLLKNFPVLKNAAIIREIHTYGQMISLQNSTQTQKDFPQTTSQPAPQHHGLGKKLMGKAEKIAKEEFSAKKMAIIAGVGVRGYFRKLGYQLKDSYMFKRL